MTLRAGPERARIEIESRDKYGILWLAGIRHVNLAQHCLKTFGESDRPRVDRAAKRQTVLLPAESPPVAWYLCALPIPWSWERNAHLAFEHAPGQTWEGDALVPGLGVRLHNAQPITGWGEHSIPADAEMRQARLYRTCRNWQFGWWLRQHRNIPDAPPTPYKSKHPKTTTPGQLAFE